MFKKLSLVTFLFFLLAGCTSLEQKEQVEFNTPTKETQQFEEPTPTLYDIDYSCKYDEYEIYCRVTNNSNQTAKYIEIGYQVVWTQWSVVASKGDVKEEGSFYCVSSTGLKPGESAKCSVRTNRISPEYHKAVVDLFDVSFSK